MGVIVCSIPLLLLGKGLGGFMGFFAFDFFSLPRGGGRGCSQHQLINLKKFFTPNPKSTMSVDNKHIMSPSLTGFLVPFPKHFLCPMVYHKEVCSKADCPFSHTYSELPVKKCSGKHCGIIREGEGDFIVWSDPDGCHCSRLHTDETPHSYLRRFEAYHGSEEDMTLSTLIKEVRIALDERSEAYFSGMQRDEVPDEFFCDCGTCRGTEVM